jgi:hypothetical protein
MNLANMCTPLEYMFLLLIDFEFEVQGMSLLIVTDHSHNCCLIEQIFTIIYLKNVIFVHIGQFG